MGLSLHRAEMAQFRMSTPRVVEALDVVELVGSGFIAAVWSITATGAAQAVSTKYTERLLEARIEPSVGSVGSCGDNALAETINGLYTTEVSHRRGPWRSFEVVEFATLEWVDWFNNRRLLAPKGYIPPTEAEEPHYA